MVNAETVDRRKAEWFHSRPRCEGNYRPGKLSAFQPGGRTRSQYEGADEFNYLVVKVKGYER